MVHSDAILIDGLEVGTAKKVLKARMLSVAFLLCLKLQKEKNYYLYFTCLLKVGSNLSNRWYSMALFETIFDAMSCAILGLQRKFWTQRH